MLGVLNLCIGTVGRVTCRAIGVGLVFGASLLVVIVWDRWCLGRSCLWFSNWRPELQLHQHRIYHRTVTRRYAVSWHIDVFSDVHDRCFESLRRHRGAFNLQPHRCGSCYWDFASGCDLFEIGLVYGDCVFGCHIEGQSYSCTSTAFTTGRQLDDMRFLDILAYFLMYIVGVLHLCVGAMGFFTCSATGAGLVLESFLLVVIFWDR